MIKERPQSGPRTQQIVQVGVLIAALGSMLMLIGLYPGVTGVEPKSGIGVLQIFIILVGMTLLNLGGLLFIKVAFYPYQPSNLAQRIAIRICLTGLLFAAGVGLSDILGYGSNPPQGENSFPILGRYQVLGMVIGFLIAGLGVLLFWVLDNRMLRFIAVQWHRWRQRSAGRKETQESKPVPPSKD